MHTPIPLFKPGLVRMQSQSKVRQLWQSIPRWVACELVSLIGSHTICLDSIVTLLQCRWISMEGVCIFRCNLPSELLAEWLTSFAWCFSNTGVEQTQNKVSKPRKLPLEGRIPLPSPPPPRPITIPARIFKLTWHSFNWGIPTPRVLYELCYPESPIYHKDMKNTSEKCFFFINVLGLDVTLLLIPLSLSVSLTLLYVCVWVMPLV